MICYKRNMLIINIDMSIEYWVEWIILGQVETGLLEGNVSPGLRVPEESACWVHKNLK